MKTLNSLRFLKQLELTILWFWIFFKELELTILWFWNISRTKIDNSLILKYLKNRNWCFFKKSKNHPTLCVHGWCALHTHYCHSQCLQGYSTSLTHTSMELNMNFMKPCNPKSPKTQCSSKSSQPLVHIYSLPQQRSQSSLESSIFTKSKRLLNGSSN